MGKVIPFTGITKYDIPPEQVLRQLLEQEVGNIEGIVVMGYTNDGKEFFASTYADGGTVLWLMEQMKRSLLEVDPTPTDKDI